MSKRLAFRALFAAAAAAIPASAWAQWIPVAELLGQPVQATTAGVTNTLYFDPGGTLRIVTPGGQTVNGTWAMNATQLCLTISGQTECVPYETPFQAGVPRNMTTSCNAATSWLAQVVNPPVPAARNERGQ